MATAAEELKSRRVGNLGTFTYEQIMQLADITNGMKISISLKFSKPL